MNETAGPSSTTHHYLESSGQPVLKSGHLRSIGFRCPVALL